MIEESTSLRVLLVEDHGLLVEGIRMVLERRGHAIVGVTDKVASARQLLDTAAADVIVCDIELADGSGLDLVRAARDAGIPTLVLSVHTESAYVHEAVRAGAQGYVAKSAPPQSLVAAVEAVGHGNPYFCPTSLAALGESPTRIRNITGRELDVLEAVARGLTTKEIARELGISPRTVETHRERLMSKLGVSNAVGLAKMAIVMGLIDAAGPGKIPSNDPAPS